MARDNPYPTYDALKAEEDQPTLTCSFTISDADGNMVRVDDQPGDRSTAYPVWICVMPPRSCSLGGRALQSICRSRPGPDGGPRSLSGILCRRAKMVWSPHLPARSFSKSKHWTIILCPPPTVKTWSLSGWGDGSGPVVQGSATNHGSVQNKDALMKKPSKQTGKRDQEMLMKSWLDIDQQAEQFGTRSPGDRLPHSWYR